MEQLSDGHRYWNEREKENNCFILVYCYLLLKGGDVLLSKHSLLVLLFLN